MALSKITKETILTGFRRLQEDKQYIYSVIQSGSQLDPIELKKRGIELVTFDVPKRPTK